MDNDIEYKTSETKRDWYSTHTLTKEQYAQLIQNKIDRVRVYHEATKKANKLAGIN